MASSKQIAGTGITGLDDVLRGGFPRDRTYLLKGHPGVGKTTVALQFLLEGLRHGEVCLYITLSETLDELEGVARSHGWSLEGLDLFELRQPTAGQDEGHYTMYHPSEVELRGAMEAMLREVDRLRPARVVIDSLSEIRLLAEQTLRYRRQVLAMKQAFVGKRCTVLMLDDLTADPDTHLDSLAHGVVAMERQAPLYGGARRRLEVVKLRGVRFLDGYHDIVIEEGGVKVFPRLVASHHPAAFSSGRLVSGVAELDSLLGGGVDRGTATVIIGPAGSGKSAISNQFVLAAANQKEHAVIYTLDESVGTLFVRSESQGMPLRALAESKLLRVQQVDPAEMSPGQFAYEVRNDVERRNARVVVIDSLTGYLNAMPDERFLLSQLHELLTYLAQHGVVTFLVATQHGLIGTAMSTPVDVSYLADSAILLRYFEASGTVRNAISVVKKRTGAHERTIRELSITGHGVRVGQPLHDFHGILTGVPTYTGRQDPLLGGPPWGGMGEYGAPSP